MPRRKYPSDWKSHIFQAQSTRSADSKPYRLELVEFEFSNLNGPVLLMVPGYFQNAFVFDLLPDQQVSFARHLATRFNFHIFALHPNGIGRSDYIKKSDLDDIAIDDIDGALKVLKKSYSKHIFVMGHSNGSITLQMYFAGLGRSVDGNVFNKDLAIGRQLGIKGMYLFAGNVCMTDDDAKSRLKKASRFATRIKFILKGLGWINARLLTRFISPTKLFGGLSAAYWKFWSFLYHIENVSKESRKALYNQSLDGTSAATLIQYSNGVLQGCIKTTAGIPYCDGLKNITIPCAQVCFGLDPLAVPHTTERDSFSKIGSQKKKFFTLEDQGHEDFMMNGDFHEDVDPALLFLHD